MSENETNAIAESPADPYDVTFGAAKEVEFVTKSGVAYILSGITSVERTPDGGLVLRKSDDNYCTVEPGFEFLDVRELSQ